MKKILMLTLGFILISTIAAPKAHALLLGPSAYLKFADSPFSGGGFGSFFLEDFEDHLLNTIGLSANNGLVTSLGFSGSIIDSVDADDADATNGSCLGCDSYFSGGLPGITFSFDALALGGLPTSAGLVWTDGSGTIIFEAFDNNGVSLGTLNGTHADGTFFGTTAEDRFYGAVNASGISKIFISNITGGIEVDHIQYGLANGENGGTHPIPEPATMGLLSLGLMGMGMARRKKIG